jgi:NADPH:quinone reductase-like Zn-dependent oxidoreductase
MTRAFAIASREEAPAVEDVTTANPGAGQARVRVEAASINGFDAAVAAGYLWEMLPAEFPVVLGRDFAGVVEAVGEGVTSPAVGDRVAGAITAMTLGLGSITESLDIPADSLVAIPDSVTTQQAAAATLAGLTAVSLVQALALGADDTVLVSGASGGVGSFAVQLAASTGATVLATGRPDAADFLTGLGAAAVIDYTGDLEADVAKAAPGGPTAVIHTAGDPPTLGALLPAGGRLASALGATNETVGRVDVTVTGVSSASAADHLGPLLQQIADGTLVVPIAASYSLDEATRALDAFRGHKLGKLVVTVA